MVLDGKRVGSITCMNALTIFIISFFLYLIFYLAIQLTLTVQLMQVLFLKRKIKIDIFILFKLALF